MYLQQSNNDIDTKNIPIQECIAILSNNSKSKIKFEISDSNYLNKQIITIKPKSGFKTETGNVDFSIRNLSQSYIFPILKQENSLLKKYPENNAIIGSFALQGINGTNILVISLSS